MLQHPQCSSQIHHPKSTCIQAAHVNKSPLKGESELLEITITILSHLDRQVETVLPLSSELTGPIIAQKQQGFLGLPDYYRGQGRGVRSPPPSFDALRSDGAPPPSQAALKWIVRIPTSIRSTYILRRKKVAGPCQ